MKTTCTMPDHTLTVRWRAAGAAITGGEARSHPADRHCLVGRSGHPIDRHVGSRLGGEFGSGPIRVPALQLESGELGHEVELRRPDVAMRAAVQLGAVAVICLLYTSDAADERSSVDL